MSMALNIPASSALRRMWTDTNTIQKIAFAVGLALLVMAFLGPLVAPHDPDAQSLLARLRPPIGFERANPAYPLGTDELGRDILSRSLHGLRLTLMLAILGALLGLLFGGLLGLLAGVVGGRTDAVIMSAVDTQIAVPFTLIALFTLAIFGSSLQVMVIVLGLAGWEQYARIVRGDVRRLMHLPFIEAARAAGAGPRRIAFTHLLPNIVSPLVVQFTLSLSNIVLLESTLSFLGLGVQPPTATLGSMVGIGRDYMPTAPWIVIVPALLIVLLTFAVQVVGDWLRDSVDVRLRAR
ncbi:ABC transporter permease [Thioclava marina]|uniref:ABC transporter permease n=1 Tax=Thioclava marina TaxID=1915077 RepID=A0ABX3ML12_9RHOB|nr:MULTISPECIES: ABC transporter permease [Thioclava]MBD3802876.1 ABC transporter permease [Thioclava sp.]OOY11926.1 ABC transporter permease [Thioclava marina]